MLQSGGGDAAKGARPSGVASLALLGRKWRWRTVEKTAESPVSGGGSGSALPVPALPTVPRRLHAPRRPHMQNELPRGRAAHNPAISAGFSVDTTQDQMAVGRSPSVRPGLAAEYFAPQNFLLLTIGNWQLGAQRA